MSEEFGLSMYMNEEDKSKDDSPVEEYRMPRRIVVEIDFYNSDKKARVMTTLTMFTDTLIGHLAGKIHNVAIAIPYVPMDFQYKPLKEIRDLSDAIQKLSAEEILPFEFMLSTSDGLPKNYRVISEMK